MKQRLSRKKLSKICADYDAGALSGARPSVSGLPRDVVYVYASETIPAGSPVKITGFKNVSTYETVLRLWTAGRLVMAVSQGTDADGAHAFALEPVKSAEVGFARLKKAFVHEIECPDSGAYNYANGSFEALADSASASSRAFRIAAQSSENASHVRVAVLIPYLSAGYTPTVTKSAFIFGISGSVSNGVLVLDVNTANAVTGVS